MQYTKESAASDRGGGGGGLRTFALVHTSIGHIYVFFSAFFFSLQSQTDTCNAESIADEESDHYENWIDNNGATDDDMNIFPFTSFS